MTIPLAQLRAVLAKGTSLRGPGRNLSSGIPALDQCLPLRGFPGGALVEWLSEPGTGAMDLAMRSLTQGALSKATWCAVDLAGSFFNLPAGSRRVGTPACCIVRPRTVTEAWWSMEQILRCPGIAMTWCQVNTVPDKVLRRWQLAAEAGGGVGMLFRPLAAGRQSSWADLRLRVRPVVRPTADSEYRTLLVEVVHCRGHLGGQSVVLELHHATGAVRLVSQLAHSEIEAG